MLKFLKFFFMVSDFVVGLFLFFMGLHLLFSGSYGEYTLEIKLTAIPFLAFGITFWFFCSAMWKGLGWKYRWFRLSLYSIALVLSVGAIHMALPAINLLAHVLWSLQMRNIQKAKAEREGQAEKIRMKQLVGPQT